MQGGNELAAQVHSSHEVRPERCAVSYRGVLQMENIELPLPQYLRESQEILRVPAGRRHHLGNNVALSKCLRQSLRVVLYTAMPGVSISHQETDRWISHL
jgi:hypothetical protein